MKLNEYEQSKVKAALGESTGNRLIQYLDNSERAIVALASRVKALEQATGSRDKPADQQPQQG